MSGESPEVKLARMEERLNTVLEALELARDSRKQQYEKLEELNRNLLTLDSRVGAVEKSLAAAAPTIDEFVNIKLKVQGAGIAGKYAWAIGASIITFLFTIRESIIAWMTK